MFKRRDIPPVLLLLLLIILVMLTLSQILVVHNGRYGRNVHNMRKLQLELREMDINLHSLMLQNVPSIELNRRLLQNEINAGRIAHIIKEAGETQKSSLRRGAKKHMARTETVDSANHGNHSGGGLRNGSTAFLSEQLAQNGSSGSADQTVRTSWIHEMTSKNNRTGLSSADSDQPRGLIPAGRTGQSPPNASVSWPQQDPSPASQAAAGSPGQTRDIHQLPSHQHQRLIEKGLGQKSSTNVIKYCPSIPPSLVGKVDVHVDINHAPSVSDVVRENPKLLPGGTWKPLNCTARHRVAVIIPYRDREEHLMILLKHLHPMLQKQQLDYRIVVVEQYGSDTFNKARIMNIAFVEVLKRHHFHCFVFHDVDLVPEDDRNMYSCPAQPRHMSVAIDEMGYKLAYQELVGGVLNMRTEHFQRVNGYSNLYWGWGAEDDDMAYRIMHVGLKITRPPDGVARYKMVKHTKRKPADWRKRAKLLYTGTRRFQFDGLNSLQYKMIHIEDRPLFTHILVDIGKPPRGF